MIEVYWNSRRRCFSVREKGRVVEHAAALVISSPHFLVNARARDRVRATGRKTVHAFVRGERSSVPVRYPLLPLLVSYNPYENLTFVTQDGAPIFSARQAWLRTRFNPKTGRHSPHIEVL